MASRPHKRASIPVAISMVTVVMSTHRVRRWADLPAVLSYDAVDASGYGPTRCSARLVSQARCRQVSEHHLGVRPVARKVIWHAHQPQSSTCPGRRRRSFAAAAGGPDPVTVAAGSGSLPAVIFDTTRPLTFRSNESKRTRVQEV